MGRPPKPKAEKKSIMLHFRLTKAEYRSLCEAAKRNGVPLSQFIRGKVLAKEKVKA
jgi:hypothetical protein